MKMIEVTLSRGLVKAFSASFTGIGVSLLGFSAAHALPFNDDMVNINKHSRTGVMMRPKPEGSVPFGSLPYRLEKKEDAEALVNPLKGDPMSTASGKRLWAVNCLPCHGDISKTPYVPGYASAKMSYRPPDPTGEIYKTRSDGFYYGTIHFGGAFLMPPLGWKLSATEHWDIINYVRSMQNSVRETRQ